MIMLTFTTQLANANDALLEQARALIAGGEYKQAYESLQSEMISLAGDTQYDYLLGRAAIEAQEPGKAIFALERVIAAEPNNGSAHFDLARALFMVKQYEQSRKQFGYVLALRPSQQLRTASKNYLSMINKQLRPWDISGYVQLDLGEDSNANSATDERLHGVIILNDKSVETASGMIGYSINGNFEHRLSSRNSWFISGMNINRQYPSAEFVDQNINVLAGGFNHVRGKWSAHWNLSRAAISVDDIFNSSNATSQARLSYKHNMHTLSTGIINTASRFNSENSMRNVNQHGGMIAHQLLVSHKGLHVFNTQAMLAHDFPLDSGSEYKRNLASLSHLGMLGANRRVALQYNASLQFSDYKKGFLNGELVDENRNEWTKQVSLGAVIRPATNWQITSQLQFIQRQSTVSLYSFAKTNMTLGIKRNI